jgi:glycosyltransferase involved in cell wall biosynthesis
MKTNYFPDFHDATVCKSKIEYPIVSVCIITYNKELFIREALESVFLQNTKYTYEIVVGDNASSDSTPNILHEYIKNHNDKMTVIFNDYNLELTQNLYRTMCCCRGKYIIVLYGDDYWISDKKIEQQTDFLETHEDYIGVTSVTETRYDGQLEGVASYPEDDFRDADITINDYLEGHNFPMGGLMFRNLFLDEDGRLYFSEMINISRYIDDLSFCVLLLHKGKVFTINDCMSVYRIFKPNSRNNNFNSVNNPFQKFEKHISMINKLDELFFPKYNFKYRYAEHLGSGLIAALRDLKIKRFIKVYKTIPLKYRRFKDNVLFLTITRKIKKIFNIKH